jgi:hypothetical protein
MRRGLDEGVAERRMRQEKNTNHVYGLVGNRHIIYDA